MTYVKSPKNKPVDKQEYIPNLHEIVVTEAMIEAGMSELKDHDYGEDIKYVLEVVYRAMFYEGNQPQQLGHPSK